jgi:superfamily II DNA or RNA helicase
VPLRKRQQEALDAIRQEYLNGIRQQLIVMATGTGKTVVFSDLRESMKDLLPGKVLVFAHREELVDQAVATLSAANPGLKVGKEMADHWADTDCDILVSCVASIGRNGSTRLQRFGEFDIVICDEAHHSIADSYMNVFEITGVLKPGTNKLLVGFTATPKRKNLTRKEKKQVTTLDDEDIISLKSVYRKIVFSYPIRKAKYIKEGWLVPIRGFRLKTATDLSDVKTTAGDYQQDQLSHTVNTDVRNKEIVKFWLEHGEGRQTVVFTVDIRHAKDLAAVFQANGVKAEAVWGVDPERKSKLERHQRKEITILLNAQVLTEGYDDWRVSCVVPAAPTKNPSKYTQEIGRGTRLQKGTGNLLDALAAGTVLEKKDCLVLDVVDNSKRCSLVTFPSLLGLNPDMDLHGEDVMKAVEMLEEAQEKHPGVDFSKLTDIHSIKTYVESIDIFAAPFTEEVKEFSELTWMMSADGSYVLPIPEKKDVVDLRQYWNYLHEKLHITQNELDEWELSITTTQSERKLGSFSSLKETFEVADDVIRRCRADRVKLMKRESTWHGGAPSEAAKRYLRKLTKKKPILWCLCEGNNGREGNVCLRCKMKQGLDGGAGLARYQPPAARKVRNMDLYTLGLLAFVTFLILSVWTGDISGDGDGGMAC